MQKSQSNYAVAFASQTHNEHKKQTFLLKQTHRTKQTQELQSLIQCINKQKQIKNSQIFQVKQQTEKQQKHKAEKQKQNRKVEKLTSLSRRRRLGRELSRLVLLSRRLLGSRGGRRGRSRRLELLGGDELRRVLSVVTQQIKRVRGCHLSEFVFPTPKRHRTFQKPKARTTP